MTLTDFTDGDVLPEAQLDGSFSHVALKKDVSSTDTTEYSTTATSPTSVVSYTFTPANEGSIPILLKITTDMKHSTGTDGAFLIAYFDTNRLEVDYDTDISGNYNTRWTTSTSYATLTNSFYLPLAATNAFDSTPLLSAASPATSYTVDFRLWTDDKSGGGGSGTAYLTNIIIEVWYLDGAVETTSATTIVKD